MLKILLIRQIINYLIPLLFALVDQVQSWMMKLDNFRIILNSHIFVNFLVQQQILVLN